MTRLRPAVIAAVLFGAGLIVLLAISWILGSLMVQGHASRVSPARPPANDLVIETADHLHIAATFVPGRDDRAPAVLLLHGVGGSRQAVAANAEWLSTLGYATLTIDFRGHGESTLAPRSFGLTESRDAAAAFTWLKARQQGAPVAVIGISLGGAAALLGENGPLPADALILQAVYPDIRHAIRNRLAARLGAALATALEPLLSLQALPRFGVWPNQLSPIAALPRFGNPVLVIGGEQDTATPPTETRALAATAGRHTLWMVARGDHPEICSLVDTAYRSRVRTFLTAAMPVPAES